MNSMTLSTQQNTAANLLYFAYANSQDEPLEQLTIEDEKVNANVASRANKDKHYTIQRDSNATIDGMVEVLTNYNEEICLFHYSGHAGKDKLLVEDRTANAIGITELLLECPNLKLVVLNGCSTKGQVEALLNEGGEKGVPVVIATERAVDDVLATKFAIAFYKKFAINYSTIEEAFNTAMAAVKIVKKDIPYDRVATRSIINNKTNKKDPIWGIYHKNGRRAYLNWRLPSVFVRYTIASGYQPNKILFKTLFVNLKLYKEDIRNLLEEEDKNGYKQSNINEKNKMVIRSFPHNVAEQLRKLIAVNDDGNLCLPIGEDRVIQLKRTYTVTIQFLVYILIGQLWDLMNKAPEKYQFRAEEWKYFRTIFLNQSKTAKTARYEQLIQWLMEQLVQEENLFMRELDGVGEQMEFYKDEKFIDACRKIEYFQIDNTASLTEKDIKEQAANQCKEIENQLVEIFSQLLFLSNYRLVSVKNIVIKNQRHIRSPHYLHTITELEYDSLGTTEKTEPLDHIMGESSITLCRNLERVTNSNLKAYLKKEEVEEEGFTSLNLSPFLFDKNAFTTSKKAMPEILQFSGYDSRKLNFNQIMRHKEPFILDMDLIETTQESYENILKQFNSFCRLIFKKNLDQINQYE